MCTTRAYSLLDMLVTLAVAGVLGGVAWPGFTHLVLELRMTAAVNDFVHAVFLAKHTAHTIGREVTVCRSATGTQCDHDRDWHQGWLVFANLDQDYPPAIDTGERVIEVKRMYAGGKITANRSSFVFRPFEIRSTNGTLIFCDRRGPTHARAVIVSYTGRPRIYPAAGLGKPFACTD